MRKLVAKREPPVQCKGVRGMRVNTSPSGILSSSPIDLKLILFENELANVRACFQKNSLHHISKDEPYHFLAFKKLDQG